MAISHEELNEKYWEFDIYMTSDKWDELDVYADDAFKVLSAFFEFCLTGKVTDDDEEELED